MNKDEAVQKLATAGRLSIAHAEDLYDSFFEKPVVPQYVADWYEEHKEDLDESIWEYLVNWDDAGWDGFKRWLSQSDENGAITTLVNMHQFGYEVEKEPRYTVQLKNKAGYCDYLVDTISEGFRFYSNLYTQNRAHTRKELEEADFGWVFDCEGVEVKEVE